MAKPPISSLVTFYHSHPSFYIVTSFQHPSFPLSFYYDFFPPHLFLTSSFPIIHSSLPTVNPSNLVPSFCRLFPSLLYFLSPLTTSYLHTVTSFYPFLSGSLLLLHLAIFSFSTHFFPLFCYCCSFPIIVPSKVKKKTSNDCQSFLSMSLNV